MNPSINDPCYTEKIQAINSLYNVIDPELMVNVVDLGLIYNIEFSDTGEITVEMTLSTPHCPMGEAIAGGVANALGTSFPDKSVEVNIVWEPRWSHERISDAGRQMLGL